MAQFDDLAIAQEVINKLNAFSDKPCSIEMIDQGTLKVVSQASPTLLKSSMDNTDATLVLFVEFDNLNDRAQKKLVKKATKLARLIITSHTELSQIRTPKMNSEEFVLPLPQY